MGGSGALAQIALINAEQEECITCLTASGPSNKRQTSSKLQTRIMETKLGAFDCISNEPPAKQTLTKIIFIFPRINAFIIQPLSNLAARANCFIKLTALLLGHSGTNSSVYRNFQF